MNNEINQFKVQSNDPYFTANKWNETLDYSMNFEKMIKSILGPKFKGIYKVSNQYNKYDYVWYDDSIYQIIGTSNATMNISNSYGLTNVYKYKDGLLGLNQRKEIVYYTNKENIIVGINFDSFCYDYKSEKCYGVKNNRIYSIDLNTKNVDLLNIIFNNSVVKIDKILCDEANVFIKSSNSIYKSNFINTENTAFEPFYKSDLIVDFDISNNYVFIVTLDNGINIVSKSKGNNLSAKINTNVEITTDVKIASINNNAFALYDGRNNIYTFFNNGNGIYNLEDTIVNYDGFNSGLYSLTKSRNNIIASSLNNTIVSIPANKYSIKKVDTKKVFSRKSNIEIDPLNVSCCLNYKDGYYTYKEKDYLLKDECTFEYKNYLPSLSGNTKIVFDFNSVSFYKTLMLKIKTSSNGQYIGCLHYNNMSYPINLPEFEGNEITIFLEYKDNSIIETFITDDNIIEVLDVKGSSSSRTNIFELTSEYKTDIYDLVLFAVELEIDYKDYLSNNNIVPIIDVLTNPIPYSKVHIDENGNLPIQIKGHTILKSNEGIHVNVSNNYEENNGEVVFSTAGANSLYNKMNKELNDSLKELSNKTHTHDFSEIKNIPNASQTVKGITTLAQSVSDSTNTAVTPKAVKTFCDTFASKTHNHYFKDLSGVPISTTAEKGIVQLHNSVDSESNMACTPSAVNLKLNEYLHKTSGGTIGGTLNTNVLNTNSFTIGGWKIEVIKV